MKMTDAFIAQVERETPISRRVLERVPEGQPNWKPHEKSMNLGYLATLVAFMPSWIAMAIERDELDLRPAGGSTFKPPVWKTTADLTGLLEESAAQARSDCRYLQPYRAPPRPAHRLSAPQRPASSLRLRTNRRRSRGLTPQGVSNP